MLRHVTDTVETDRRTLGRRLGEAEGGSYRTRRCWRPEELSVPPIRPYWRDPRCQHWSSVSRLMKGDRAPCSLTLKWSDHTSITSTGVIKRHNYMHVARMLRSSRTTWSRGQNFRPRPRPRAMLASFSRRLSSCPRCQSSKSRHLRYVLLW